MAVTAGRRFQDVAAAWGPLPRPRLSMRERMRDCDCSSNESVIQKILERIHPLFSLGPLHVDQKRLAIAGRLNAQLA